MPQDLRISTPICAYLRQDPDLDDIDPDNMVSDEIFHGYIFERGFKRGWILRTAREDQFAEDLWDVAGVTLAQIGYADPSPAD